jgi:hypothetical protein
MMPEDKNAEITQVFPPIKEPIFDALRGSQVKKTLEDMGLERVVFTYKDSEGKLRSISPIVTLDTMNAILSLLEESEI